MPARPCHPRGRAARPLALGFQRRPRGAGAAGRGPGRPRCGAGRGDLGSPGMQVAPRLPASKGPSTPGRAALQRARAAAPHFPPNLPCKYSTQVETVPGDKPQVPFPTRLPSRRLQRPLPPRCVPGAGGRESPSQSSRVGSRWTSAASALEAPRAAAPGRPPFRGSGRLQHPVRALRCGRGLALVGPASLWEAAGGRRPPRRRCGYRGPRCAQGPASEAHLGKPSGW